MSKKKDKKIKTSNDESSNSSEYDARKRSFINTVSQHPTSLQPKQVAAVKEASDMVKDLEEDNKAFDTFESKMEKDDPEIKKSIKDVQDTSALVGKISKEVIKPIKPEKEDQDFFDPRVSSPASQEKAVDDVKKKIDFKVVPEKVFSKYITGRKAIAEKKSDL
jgi:hypothetical protein